MNRIIYIVMSIGFFAMGIVQVMAMFAFLTNHWEWPTLLAAPIGLILSYMPLIGSICGFLGAIYAWHWEWWQAALLFFWYPVVYFLLFITGYSMEIGSTLFRRKDSTQQSAPFTTTPNGLCLFGSSCKIIKKHFPLGIWVLRVYFLLICFAYATMLFLLTLSLIVNTDIYFMELLPVLALIAFTTWAIYSMYRVKMYGYAAMPLLAAIGIVLTAMQIIDSRTTPRELFGFLFGCVAVWISWKVRRLESEEVAIEHESK